jgi:hypothetical protein
VRCLSFSELELMTQSIKATRTTVQLGGLTLDGFMLPDGTYRMSQTQMAETVAKPEINARRFLDSKAAKALLSKDYTPDTVEIESIGQTKGTASMRCPWRW